MHWQYWSISRGDDSIYVCLQKQGIQPERYIEFYGLRAYDQIQPARQNMIPEFMLNRPNIVPDYHKGEVIPPPLPPRPVENPSEIDERKPEFVTELLYIHSKLMIVDDRAVICGSGTIDY